MSSKNINAKKRKLKQLSPSEVHGDVGAEE